MPDQEETITRIEKLERELAALTTRVANLESPDGGSITPQPSASPPDFTAILTDLDPGPFREVRITGSGFHGDEPVTLLIRSVMRFSDGRQEHRDDSTELRANAEGKLEDSIGIECPVGARTTHTIRARGSLSGPVPGDATVFC